MDKWNGHIIDPQNDFRNNQSILHKRKKKTGRLFKRAQAFISQTNHKRNAEKLMLCQKKRST